MHLVDKVGAVMVVVILTLVVGLWDQLEQEIMELMVLEEAEAVEEKELVMEAKVDQELLL
jgi:hypothetical protein